MRKLDCNSCGSGGIPRPVPDKSACGCRPDKITLRTQIIPANLGSDNEGEPFAPKPGDHYNLIMIYQATGQIWIYDSNGVPTLIKDSNIDELEAAVEVLEAQMAELYIPTDEYDTVESFADLEEYDHTNVPVDGVIRVEHDETHDGQASIYFWNPSLKAG